MFVPSMLNMADVMAESCYTEEQVFDLGLSKAIVFLVVVPLVGACRVPNEALSHFMAGADEYTADAMPEHYSGALSGQWTIKRERLRILPASWGKWVTDVEEIQALCELCELQDAAPIQAPLMAVGASSGVEPNKASPLPLTTGDVAFCFAGLRWGEQKWKKPLGDKPKWLAACIAIPGVRGVSETRWNPVLIGAALEHYGHAKSNSIRARFQTKSQLAPWLEAWKTYEADNFPTEYNTAITPGVNPGNQ